MNLRNVGVASTAAVALLLLHCSSGGAGTFGGDGGTEGGGLCPATAPTANSSCSLPNGTVCNQYPTAQPGCYCCGTSQVSYECKNGKWIETVTNTGGPPSGGTPVGCPATVPTEGSPCAQCGAQLSCSYSCATGNGYLSQAQCVNGAWHVTKSLAPCEADGSLGDAGDGGDAAVHDAADSG